MGLNIYDYIYMISGIFGAYITYRYMRVFFDIRRTNSRAEFVSYLLYFLLITTIYYSFNTPVLNLTSNLLFFLLLSLNYRASLRDRIFYIIFIYIILIAIESLVAFISGYFYYSIFVENPYYSTIWGMVSIRILSFLASLLLGNFKNIRKGINIPKIYWITIFLIPLGSLYVFLILLQNYGLNKFSMIASIIILFLININTFYLYDTLNKFFEDKIEKLALDEQNKFYQMQLETLTNSHKNTRSIRHDINNHLVALRNYIENDEKEKAVLYISNIKDMSYKTKEFSRTGNMDIDSILNYKLNKAKSKGISTSLKSNIPSKLNVRSIDIVVILGNLLDNAIYASSKAENSKNIKIRINYLKGSLFIFISNTYKGNIRNEGGKFKTTKKDSTNHGIGLSNIETILMEYDGTMKISYTEDIFNVDIFMYLD